MYKPFKIFSIVSTIVSILLLLGWKYKIDSDIFYGAISIYFLITGFTFFVLLFKDKKYIFKKPFILLNIVLYIFTTPIPFIATVLFVYFANYFKHNSVVHKDITEYRVCEGCLQHEEAVEIIYSSGGPDINKDKEFYYHYIGVSQLTRDTFNILTTAKLLDLSSNNVKNYLSANSEIARIFQNTDKLNAGATISEIAKIQPKEISNVIYNPGFSILENNHYKTVIGELGEVLEQ